MAATHPQSSTVSTHSAHNQDQQSQDCQHMPEGYDEMIRDEVTQPPNSTSSQSSSKGIPSNNPNPPRVSNTDQTKILQEILLTIQDSKIAEPSGKDTRSRFWAKYKKVSEEYDNEFLDRHNGNMDILLIFAGLFSAVNTAFIIAMNPNPSDTTNVLLTQLIHANGGGSTGTDPTVLPKTLVWSQPLAYASLSLSLLAAFGSVLGKQWLAYYKLSRFGHNSLEERGIQRQRKLHGIGAWHLDAVLQSFPVLLQISLLIFAAALSAYVWTQQAATFGIVIGVTGTGIFFYSFIVYVALLSPDCPFQTPVSAIIRVILVQLARLRTRQAWNKLLERASRGIGRTQLGRKIMQGTGRSFQMLQHSLSSYIIPAFTAAVTLTSAGFVHLRDFISALACGCHSLHLPGQDIEAGQSAQSVEEEPEIRLDIPLIPTSIFYAHSLKWLMETSTDPDVFLAAASLVPDCDSLLSLDGVSSLYIQLKDGFMGCFDDHDRCIPGADDKAIICGLALTHMYWRRHLRPFDKSMLLPGELHYGKSTRSWDIQVWGSFIRRWRYFESKDPKFLIVSQTGIGTLGDVPNILENMDLRQYPDAFLTSLLPSLSCTFLFGDRWALVESENIVSKLLHSSPEPSAKVVANCTFLVLCMLGHRFSNADVANANKNAVIHNLVDELVWQYPVTVLAQRRPSVYSELALRLAGVVSRILQIAPTRLHSERRDTSKQTRIFDKAFIKKQVELCIDLLDRPRTDPLHQEAPSRVRAALRTIITAGGNREHRLDDDSLILEGEFGWGDTIHQPQVLRCLLQYLEHCRQEGDYVGLEDALLVASDTWRFGSDMQKVTFLEILSFCLGAEFTRLRRVGLQVACDSRVALAAGDNTGNVEVGERLLTTFSKALLTAISLEIESAKDIWDRQEEDPGVDRDSWVLRKQRYLRLIITLVNSSSWVPTIIQGGHLDRCITLLRQLSDSRSAFYSAVIFLRIEASDHMDATCLNVITEDDWCHIIVVVWDHNDSGDLKDCFEMLPALAERTIKCIPRLRPGIIDYLRRRVVDVLDGLEEYGVGQGIRSALENLLKVIDETKQRQQ